MFEYSVAFCYSVPVYWQSSIGVLMKLSLIIFGLILIAFGGASFYYQSVSFSTTEQVAELKLPEVGHLQVTEKKEKKIEVPPVVSGISLVAGLVLLSIGLAAKKRK